MLIVLQKKKKKIKVKTGNLKPNDYFKACFFLLF